MVIRLVWLWLSAGWLITWLTEAIINPTTTSICDLGPCRCVRGKLHCDCTASKLKDIILKDIEEGSFSSISVSNCSHLHLASHVVSGLPALQQISVANVARFTLDEYAFSWSTDNPHHNGLLVNITNCDIPEIPSYSFRGSLRDVLLSSVNISRIRAYAFSSIDHADRIIFNKVAVAEVEPQAFKKFSVNFLGVSESIFNILPTRTMVDVEVHHDLKFERLKIDTIMYSGLKIHGPRHFLLSRSVVRHLEHNAFHVHTRGSVSIMGNILPHVEKGAFIGITVERRYLSEAGKQDLTFENNTLIDFESAPLIFNTTGFSPRLDMILINQKCSCQDAGYWETDLVYFSSDPSISTPVPHVSNVIYCFNDKTTTNIKDYQRLFCNIQGSNILLTLVFTAGSIISLSILLMLVYFGFKERAKRYINVPNSPSPIKQPNKNHILVIPDGKTYRETELHVIVEHAEPIVPTDYVRSPQGSELQT